MEPAAQHLPQRLAQERVELLVALIGLCRILRYKQQERQVVFAGRRALLRRGWGGGRRFLLRRRRQHRKNEEASQAPGAEPTDHRLSHVLIPCSQKRSPLRPVSVKRPALSSLR